MSAGARQARVEDVHDLAEGMPDVTVELGSNGKPAYRVGELRLPELTELVQDAWLARASRARAAAWPAGQDGR